MSTLAITGPDGFPAIYDPIGGWRMWALFETYNGTVGLNKYVPKVNDYVVDTDTDEKYKVIALDLTTYIPTLKKITGVIDSGEFSDEDVLLGVGPGTASDTFRVYLNTAVIPHTLAVDARLSVKGSNVVSAMIFRGSVLDGTSRVISAFYDTSGNMLGQAIPLELVQLPGSTNKAVKAVPVCMTTEEMPDNEIVTIVFYNAVGGVVSKRQLLVENTAFIRSTDSSVKYITGISLESPFLSATDPSLIQYPINVNLAGFNLIGVVHYSDGTSSRQAVNGGKFQVFGLENFVATIVGQKAPMLLKYTLSDNEVVYGSTVAGDRFITKAYKLQTSKSEGIYTPKLFGYPVWVDAISGYRLEWFMVNLDRNQFYNVTPYVRINENTAPFSPLAYGITQRISVSVNLKDVNSQFTSYVHVQTLEIVLREPGTARTTNWTLGFESAQNPPFGVNNYAASTFVNQSNFKIKIDMGETVFANWLDRIFYRTKPLVDTEVESTAPEPNFFAFVLGGVEVEFPITQWNIEHVVSATLVNSGTVFVKFFKRTTDTDLILGVTGLPIYQQN